METKSETIHLTMEWIEEKLIRPLTDQERNQVRINRLITMCGPG